MPIVTAPVMDALSQSQDGYEIPVTATTAHNKNIPGPSSSAAHATVPYASPRNSSVVLGFEHYTSNLYPELDSPENKDYTF